MSNKKSKNEILIKKYTNRRLYFVGTSTYVTLENLRDMVIEGKEFKVIDVITEQDITHQILSQIIFEKESKNGNFIPIKFLRDLIYLYNTPYNEALNYVLEGTFDSFHKVFTNKSPTLNNQLENNYKVFESYMNTWKKSYSLINNKNNFFPEKDKIAENDDKNDNLEELYDRIEQQSKLIDKLRQDLKNNKKNVATTKN